MNNSKIYDFDWEQVYERMGSSWLIDSIYLFIITPFGIIGCVLNLFSLFILDKITITQTKLYKYLSFHSLNGSILCLVFSFIFVSLSPRYYPYFTSYFSRFHRAFIFSGVHTCLYFIGNLLDLIIALDRLSIFIKSLKPIARLNPYIVCLTVVIISTLTNLPVYYSYYVKEDEEFYNDIKYNISTFTYSGRTRFFNSQIGNLITFIQIVIRDILTLIMEIVISSISFYYFRKFNNYQIQINFTASTINSNRQEAIQQKMIKDRKLLLLNLIQISLSLISHIFVCLSYIFVLKGVTTELIFSICISNIAICLKHFSNFFLFFFFNSNFKNHFYSLFVFNTDRP